MRTGKTLVELAQELERIQENKRDFIVPTSMLKAEVEVAQSGPQIKLGFEGKDESFNLTNWSSGQLSDYADIPKKYFDKIKEQNPALLAHNINHGLKVASKASQREGRMIRTLDGKIRGLMSPSYRILDAHDLMEATLPTLMGNNFNVMSSEITEKRLYLKAISPKVEGEVAKGDIVQYGVTISTSDVGAGSLRVEPFFYRLVCENGMIGMNAFRTAHITKNQFEAQIQELLSDNTKKLNDAAFYATVNDYLMSSMRPEVFERELNKFREASERKITNFDLEKVVELTMNEIGLKGEVIKKGVLNALASGNEGAGLTQWGLVNSFTKAAHSIDELDYETSTDLERAGGQILELSPSQWKKVAIA